MKNRIFATILLVSCLIGLTIGPARAEGGGLPITDLGTLGGGGSMAFAINEQGQVVGSSATASGEEHAFLWENGNMKDLGTLGGSFSEALDINDTGQVVGFSLTSSGDQHGFLYENGLMKDLGTLGGTYSSAYQINNQGQVIGSSSTVSGNTHAFLWQDGTMIDLTGLQSGVFSLPADINEKGQVVGYNYPDAFLWQNGILTILPSLGDWNASASSINEYGQIAGSSFATTYDNGHAVLWDNGILVDLGTLGGSYSSATMINDNGQAIGYSLLTSNNEGHAFLWDDGFMSDLGALGTTYSSATDINEKGQVIGTYGNNSETGSSSSFLWENGNMMDIGTLGGCCSLAFDINNHGQIVGYSLTETEVHAAIWTFTTTVINVLIDIKPGSNTNPINLGAKGAIPVAVLTTPEFNATTIDPATVLFAGAAPLRWTKQDVDYDGDMDLLFHFDVKKLQLTGSSVQAPLTGKTFDGTPVEGKDKVKIVPVASYP